MAKNLTSKQKRCEDCACLIVEGGKWKCDECFGQCVEDIDDCPEGITLDELAQIEEHTKDVKVDTGARAEKSKKESKPRTVKISDEKQTLFAQILSELEYEYSNNVQILKQNKLISVKIGEKVFKIDIIEQRPVKNK